VNHLIDSFAQSLGKEAERDRDTIRSAPRYSSYLYIENHISPLPTYPRTGFSVPSQGLVSWWMVSEWLFDPVVCEDEAKAIQVP
jgi:hypothetical protein